MLYDVISVKQWLILTSMIFSIGLYGFLIKQNIIGILISVEIMLNIVGLNFVIFNQYWYSDLVDGKIMSIFIIAIAAIETVVGLAILILLFRIKKSNKIKYLIMKQR
jgi:NADH-quinone oxidoreductase subunit K